MTGPFPSVNAGHCGSVPAAGKFGYTVTHVRSPKVLTQVLQRVRGFLMSTSKLMAISLLAVCAIAQTDRAIVTGTVTDSSGAAVPGAKVTAKNVATNVGASTETTSSGDFTIPNLPVGTY